MQNLLKLWAKASARRKLNSGYMMYPKGLCSISAATAFLPMFPNKTVNELADELAELEDHYYEEVIGR